MAGRQLGAGFRDLCAGLLVSAALAGCSSPEVRGHALYPPEPALTRKDVALLIGPVETVDGSNVGAYGLMFELLPGCHIVEVGNSVGHVGDPETLDAVSRSRVYAFRMSAGHTYTIEVPRGTALACNDPRRTCSVAREENRNGHVAFVPPAMSKYDIETCRQWRPESSER
jgi:hypothetical protein